MLHAPQLQRADRQFLVHTDAMGDAAKKLFEDGLNLPEDERLDLASALWASVAREPDAAWEDAWKAEIERRVADSRPSVAWDEVRRDLQAKLTKR